MKIVVADFLTGMIDHSEPIFKKMSYLMRFIVFLSLGWRIWFDFSGYSVSPSASRP